MDDCMQQNVYQNNLPLYVENVKSWEILFNRKWIIDKELSVKVIENGYVLPMLDMKKNGNYMGGVTDEKFDFFAGLLRNSPSDINEPGYYGCSEAYSPEIVNAKQIEDECVFGGVICFHFGHFILESMGRLWYYLELIDSIDKNELPYICFTVVGEKKTWFNDFFSLLGIPNARILYADKPMHFSRIIVPEESVHSWHSFHPNYMLPYKRIVSVVERSPYKKIYLTRTAFENDKRKCVNEEYFENFFEDRGFKVIAPEKYTVEEQIALISSAEVLVSTLGTLSHFALFTKPGTKIISLISSSMETLPPQCLIAEAAESHQYIVDVASNYLYESRVVGVSLLGPTTHWKQFVHDFFGEECRDVIDSNTYMNYVKEWLQYYCNPKRYYLIRDIDNFEMLRKGAKVLLNKELDKSKFDIGKTKKEYQKIMDEQEKEINSYKESYQKVRLHKAIETRQRSCMNQCLEKIYQYGLADGIYNSGCMKGKNDSFLERMLHGGDFITHGTICYKVHGADYGWTDIHYENEIAGIQCSGRRLEAFTLDSIDDSVQFVYSVYINGQGWCDNVFNGGVAGTVGKSLPMQSIRIAVLNYNDFGVSVRYKASLNGQWSEYAYDGEALDTFDWKYIEALQIELVLNQTLCNDAFLKIAQYKKAEKEKEQRLEEEEATLKQEIARLQAIHSELMNDKSKLENEIHTLQVRNSQVEGSRSWRITKPLRRIYFWWMNHHTKLH